MHTQNLIGMAGLPGSGKSTLLKKLVEDGYRVFDNINNNEGADCRTKLSHIKNALSEGHRIAVSEIMFCTEEWRTKLTAFLGPLHWICFENQRNQCMLNCLHRKMYEEPNRDLQREFQLITELSNEYHPIGEVHAVHVVNFRPGWNFAIVPLQKFPEFQ